MKFNLNPVTYVSPIRTLEHIEGDILLTMPDIPELEDPNFTDEILTKNKQVIEHLEDVIMCWGVHIQKVTPSVSN